MNAVLSDVHGNLPALEAVLDDLYYHPIDRIIFAGDFIGGPQPVETFLRLSSVEAIMITGNSDTNLTKLRTGQAPREWHVRRILRERGIPLVGQKPETMLQRIPLKALLGEINMTMLQEMEVFQITYPPYGNSAITKGWSEMGEIIC